MPGGWKVLAPEGASYRDELEDFRERRIRLTESVARDLGIDVEGPAIDAASQGLGGFHALMAEPVGNIETAHAVMTEADDVVVGVELLEIGGNGAHGNEHSAFDVAKGMFVGLADIDEEELVAAVEPLLDFNCGDF